MTVEIAEDPLLRNSDHIPAQAEPRGQIGKVAEMRCCYCSYGRAPVVRETVGGCSRRLFWKGPDAEALRLGPDLRQSAKEAGGFDKLLLAQVQTGAFSACIPETHTGVIVRIEVPEAAQESLRALGQDVHNAYTTGCGDYNVDEYCVVFDHLPNGFDSKEAFLAAFLRSPNRMANDHTASWKKPHGVLSDFNTYSRFELRRAGTKETWTDDSAVPGVGDWYHIRIPGNNGDVVIVDTQTSPQRSSATVATMTDQEMWVNDNHPVSGRRQFGVEMLEGGPLRFYTRGFDRQTNVFMDLQVGNMAQHQTWNSCMRAMGKEHGGHAEQQGTEIWGWCRQLPAEVLASCVRTGRLEPGLAEEGPASLPQQA